MSNFTDPPNRLIKRDSDSSDVEIKRDEKGRFLEGHEGHQAMKGRVPWNKGKTGVSQETHKRMSEAKKGKIPWNKGLTKDNDPRVQAIAESQLGIPHPNLAGENHPFYGKHHSEETRRKISEAKQGQGGHPQSEEARLKISKAIRGEKHWGWKGGYEKYQGPNSHYQRRLARDRDKGICQDCGKKEIGKKHDTHHIIPFKVYGLERYEEENDLENLTTLCVSCHQIRHKEMKAKQQRPSTLTLDIFS